MSKVKVNYKSDLPPIEITFKVNNVAVDVPDHDFVLRFFVDGCSESYYCGCRYVEEEEEFVPEYSRCAPTSNGSKLTCYINNHKFTPGRLRVEMIDLATNENYEDGVKKTVVPDILDIYLIEGIGDEVDNVVADTFDYKVGRGILSVTKTGTVGVVDTYTITFDDGTTTTYTITNGHDGVSLGDVAIADDLVTDDSTMVLSAKQGKILQDEAMQLQTYELASKTYTSTDLAEGKVYSIDKSVGDTLPSATFNQTGWGCMLIPIHKGDVFTVATKGGATARAYALADNDRKCLIIATTNKNTLSTPDVVAATEDGWLYVHCDLDYASGFSVVHQYSEERRLINENATDIASVNLDISSLNQYAVGKTRITSSSLTEDYYYNLTRDKAPAVPSSYSAYSYTWYCTRIEVLAGQVVTISTEGGGNARAYALTNKSLGIYERAEADENTTSSPVTLTVEKDGYLYVNCKSTSVGSFYVDTMIDVPSALSSREVESLTSAKYQNNPLPLWKDTLKVLAIGNSFTQDPTEYLGSIVTHSGIDKSKLCVYIAIQSNASLETWVDNYDDEATLNITRMAGDVKVGVETSGKISGTLEQHLAHDWDVVVLQQVSTSSNDYSTFEPYLSKLVGYIREKCTNQKVSIAWQLTWSDKSDNSGSAPKDFAGWQSICETVQEMVVRNGINIVIPTGTAIQNARTTTTFGSHNGYMTRDGHHLAYGVGRYIAACTWFQTLIAPMFNVSIIGNTATIDVSSQTSDYDAVSVTNENKGLCQRCAFDATIDMYNVTTHDEE